MQASILMQRRPYRQRSVILALVVFLGGGLLPALPAGAQQGDGSPEALEWAMLEAETALRLGEPESAESQYRQALLEGRFLLGMLDVSVGDLPAAGESLEGAIRASALPTRRARTLLALVRLRSGAADEAVRALRLLVRQQPEDTVTRRQLILALAAADDEEGARQELEALRGGAAEAAAGLAEALDGTAEVDLLPALETGALSGLTSEQRSALRQRLVATLARITRNLGAMQAWAGRPARAEALFAEAEAIAVDAPGVGAPFGQVELRRDEPPRRVARQHLDPAALRSAAPESLAPVVRLIDEGNLSEAESELRRILAKGEDPATRDLLGALLSHQERYLEAEQELVAAITAAPKLLPARQHLARVYLLLGRQEQAAKQLRYAAELGPLERDLALELAAIEQAAGRIPAANHQLRSVARRFESPRALLQLSRIASQRENHKLALGFTERALKLAPSSEEVLALHTRNALAVRIPSTAAKSVEPLARMHPTVAEYQYLLGRVWIQVGNMAEAAESLLAAVALDPQFQTAFLPLGLALNHENRYDEARSYLTRYLSAAPGDLEALAALAEAEERLDRPEVAERLAGEVLERDGDHAAANLVVAMVRMRQGRFAEAREALEKSVAADPERAKAHYQLSQACARLGDKACAQRHLELYRKAQKGPEGGYLPVESLTGADERQP